MAETALRFCVWCLDPDPEEPDRPLLHNEATFVVELITEDGAVDQRLAGCTACTLAAVENMATWAPQADNGSYLQVRRMLPGDALLRFDELSEDEGPYVDA